MTLRYEFHRVCCTKIPFLYNCSSLLEAILLCTGMVASLALVGLQVFLSLMGLSVLPASPTHSHIA